MGKFLFLLNMKIIHVLFLQKKWDEREVDNLQITLKAARVNAGLTQAQVEAQTGYARSTLTSWESGKTFPKADALENLCRLYGIPIGNIKIT